MIFAPFLAPTGKLRLFYIDVIHPALKHIKFDTGIRNKYIYILYTTQGDTRQRSWLRHCATSRNVPTRLLKFFILPNPSSRTMALGFIQLLTEINIRKYFWGVESGRLV
jgi:hypothetical protein